MCVSSSLRYTIFSDWGWSLVLWYISQTVLNYKRELAESLGEPNDSDDPEKLWTDFKTKVLKVSESCLRDTTGTSKSFLTKNTPNIIEESCWARLQGKIGEYWQHRRVAGLDFKGRSDSTGSWSVMFYVISGGTERRKSVESVETVESHLWSTDSRPADEGIRTLHYSRPPPLCSTVKAADDTTLTLLTLSGMRIPL